MPAYFIDGVFTDNVPAWHGDGVVKEQATLTIDEAFEAAPILGCEIERVPLLATAVEDSGSVTVLDIDNAYATARRMPDGTLSYIDVVGSRYEIVQPRETGEFAMAVLAQAPDASSIKTAGVIGERAQTIWFLLDLGDFEVADEPWRRLLMVANSYDGKGGQKACCTSTRVVCENTFNAAIRGASRMFSLRHTKNIRDRAAEAATALGLAVNFDKALKELGDELAAKQLTSSRFDEFVSDLLPYDPDAFKDGVEDRKRHIANVDASRFDLAFLHSNVPNLEPIRGTAWGALQATIEWQQRYAYPDRIPAQRVAATLTDNTVNQRALDLLLAV